MMPSPTTYDLLEQTWDIIIVGTGSAALTSALSAVTSTYPPPRVLLLDKAPREWAGGNGYFTAAAYRTQHNGLEDLLPLVSNVSKDLEDKIDLPAYSEKDFLDDLKRVTEGRSSEVLGGVVVKESLDLIRWLKDVGGVEWWLSFRRQAYQVEGRWVFWGGLHLTIPEGGKGLIRSLLDAVNRHRCPISYDTDVKNIMQDEKGEVCGVTAEVHGEMKEIRSKSVILCSGGFEASPSMRKKWMGPAWELAHTRGTPYNTGELLTAAIDMGAKTIGDFSPTGCHSVAWDADSPRDGGDRENTNEYTKSGYPLGVMLNADGQRFVDEGIDLRNYTYAKFGRAILEQPNGIAFQVWDRDGQGWLRNEEYRDEIVRKFQTDSLEELAKQLTDDGLKDPAAFVKTIEEFNQAVEAHRSENPDVKLNPAIKDGLTTQSSKVELALAKSNWAVPIRAPPFLAVKVTTGITFTFGGLAINPETAAVVRADGSEVSGLYAAGEIVGGLFYQNYPGGSGLTAGGVFGRRAGKAAAARMQDTTRTRTS
ncbi:related to succinate dehydrogenase/fumarate reductase, flavoprotein subunit [Ramularia collo-cygni]|uniref:Related to succinate dehydrogenase/fumarate reductase, flavoprotein subunit n=1 Tax=Ramularia collo-cygni TaxID=112498 RepID=A0A2D3VA01_9PEZI|nr:related to succinate dehydrogenase/fumarate reductase, flavoprotein subunit [Ramularia collo-cygni]CZT24873.1 related to succinate dehydrogenase/fumarate reductase, flavoprotein subunit [Ramularia collo-cygni]